jgi:phosphate:Na+ symporter
LIASVGTDVHARRAAMAHMMFNIIGIIWIQILFFPIISLVDSMVPGSMSSQAGITAHLAMFHTTFNVINTLFFINFVNWLERIVKYFVPLPPAEKAQPQEYRLDYISYSMQDTPELNLLTAKSEVEKMARITEDMYSSFMYVFNHPEKKLKEEVKDLASKEELTDRMQEVLSDFLAHLSMENLKTKSAENVSHLMRIVHELESIGDSCYNLLILSKRRYDKKLDIPQKGLEDLRPYLETVHNYLGFIIKHMNQHLSSDEMEQAISIEQQVDHYRNTLQKSARRRIKEGSDVKAELLYMDMVRHIEKIGDHLLNIAQALRAIQ